VNEELTPEDRALLAALEALQAEPGAPSSPPAEHAASDADQAAPPGDAAEAETLTRLYHEVLGLMPFALAPAAPPPEAKTRLMTRIAGPEAAAPTAAPKAAEPPSALTPRATPAAATVVDLQGRPAPASRSRSASVPSPAGASRWLSALAAALILALLGTCGWLIDDLRGRRDAIARLAEQRDAALRHAGEVEARLGRLSAQVSSLRDSFSVVTSPAVEVCNLRAVTPEQADARGMLFVAADHQHWTMSLRGLRPPAGGKVYQLWFVAAQGTMSGGTFAARPGEPVELGSERMPAGTRAIRITLENSPGSPAPGGPDVLRNADTLHAL
jgi:Anti-sigma-K factor rskA